MKKIFNKLKNPAVIKSALAVVVVVLLAGGYLLYSLLEGRVKIDDSLISAPVIQIMPSVSGELLSLPVHEGEFVTKGDTLAIVGSDIIRSYSDSLVTALYQDTGSSVTAQTEIMELINPHHLRVEGAIDENKGLNLIKAGQVASFTVDAFPGKTYWGYVDEISPSAKQTQTAFSISSERPTQQFIVYVKYDENKYPELKMGMSAKITVYINTP